MTNAEKIIELSEKICRLSEEGSPLQNLLGFSDEVMEEKYALAYEHYRKKEYDQATACFAYLTSISPYEKKYWQALAASQLDNSDFAGALNSYSTLTALETTDPRGYFHLAYCHFRLYQISDGIEVIKQAVDIAKENNQYRELEDQARELLQTFEIDLQSLE